MHPSLFAVKADYVTTDLKLQHAVWGDIVKDQTCA